MSARGTHFLSRGSGILLIFRGGSADNVRLMGNSRTRPGTREHTQCLWCDKTGVRLDKDHVFPRALGGAKELWVPACRDCQTLISKLESEAARQSHYSLFCVMHGPPGRDKRKPGSGVIRARPSRLNEHRCGQKEGEQDPSGRHGAVLRVGGGLAS